MKHALKPRAFVAMETLLATIGMLGLLMTVSVAVARQQRATRELAATRAAVRTAEDTLALLQIRQPAPAGITIVDLPDPAPAGRKWVQVTAASEGRHATLVGLAPGGAR